MINVFLIIFANILLFIAFSDLKEISEIKTFLDNEEKKCLEDELFLINNGN